MIFELHVHSRIDILMIPIYNNIRRLLITIKQEYLTRFGYLDASVKASDVVMKKALEDFQEMAGLEITGEYMQSYNIFLIYSLYISNIFLIYF